MADRLILAATYLTDEFGNVLTDQSGLPLETGVGVGYLELANGIDFLLLNVQSVPPLTTFFQINNVG